MAWIRLSDDYNDHPKFDRLSDGAFRLWHQGMGFCRKYKTDGLIPMTSVRGFKAFSPSRMRALYTPWAEGEKPLWHVVEGFGVKVHDYLQWNPSKDEENERRGDSKERMRVLRETRFAKGVAPTTSPPVSNPVSTNRVLTTSQTSETCLHDVPGWDGKEDLQKRIESESALDARAGRLRQELYPAWYAKYRHGAKLRLVANSVEYQDALSLVEQWDDERLEKLAGIILTTDDEWVSKTDRGFRIFAVKASWADGLLAEWEAKQGKASA